MGIEDMKTRSKIGNRKGNPAYRTPSVFRFQKNFQVLKVKNVNSKKINDYK